MVKRELRARRAFPKFPHFPLGWAGQTTNSSFDRLRTSGCKKIAQLWKGLVRARRAFPKSPHFPLVVGLSNHELVLRQAQDERMQEDLATLERPCAGAPATFGDMTVLNSSGPSGPVSCRRAVATTLLEGRGSARPRSPAIARQPRSRSSHPDGPIAVWAVGCAIRRFAGPAHWRTRWGSRGRGRRPE